MDRILFMAGDFEALRFSKLSDKPLKDFVYRHFILSCLLADEVVIPVGCYFESQLTHDLVVDFLPLFVPDATGKAVAFLAISADRTDYEEDIEVKTSWFPKNSNYHKTKAIHKKAREIAHVPPFYRPGSMRITLKNCIEDDAEPVSDTYKTLKQAKENGASHCGPGEMLKPLLTMVGEQKYAILPEYIRYEMKQGGLQDQKEQAKWLDFILFKNYVISCEKAYHAYCNNPLSLSYDDIYRRIYPYHFDYRDTLFFGEFLKLFPYPELKNIGIFRSHQIRTVRASESFIQYRAIYRKVSEDLLNKFALPELNKSLEQYSEEMKEERKKEMEKLSSTIMKSTSDAEMLYQAMRHCLVNFQRRNEYLNWMALKQRTEYLLLKLTEDIIKLNDDLFKAYLQNLWNALKKKHNEPRGSSLPGTSLGDMKRKDDEKMPAENKRFAIALSFPGEYRDYVDDVANRLAKELPKEQILYDMFHQVEFAKPNLDLHLRNLYQNESELVVVFLSGEYNVKIWCGVEYRSVRVLLNEKENDRIMLIKIGKGEVDGIDDRLDGMIDVDRFGFTPEQIADFIIDRYRMISPV